MIPASFAAGLLVADGSIETTILFRSGAFLTLVSSIQPRRHRASGLSSRISALSSCLPSLVPSYREMILVRNAPARLPLFALVFLRVRTVVDSLMISLSCFVGFGVVVRTH